MSEITVTQADEARALEVFNDALGDMGSFAEYGSPSYQDGALRTIAVHLARHRTQAAGEPTCWLYENNEGHRCVQHVQGLMDLDHWTETPLYAYPPTSTPATDQAERADVAALVGAAKLFISFTECHINDEGWNGPMKTTRIVDWFGPSDFRDLVAALAPFTKGPA